MNRYQQAVKVTMLGVYINVTLILLKLFAGIIAHSGAIIADAFHSFSDLSTDIALLWGNRIAAKPADHDHKYGHGRAETMTGAGIGIFLFLVGGAILFGGISQIIGILGGRAIVRPGWFAAFAAFVSIICKEWLYRVTIIIGNETQNQAVVANAWHHRSDALSSIGVLTGISGAILLGKSWRILDPVAAVTVSFFIIKAAYDVIGKSFYELMEGSLSGEQEQKILELVKGIKGAEQAHRLRTRRVGPNVAIELHICVNKNLNIQQGHDIATKVEQILKSHFGQETFVSVHVEPLEE
ncbi:MAG: cation diffusion facilitator family transporter [Candidatus Omnitrophota bacterium]